MADGIKEKIEEANKSAIQVLASVLVGVKPALEVVPDDEEKHDHACGTSKLAKLADP